nr:fasciclin-like arabinogalactan protein 17 [Ipomoea trifida]
MSAKKKVITIAIVFLLSLVSGLGKPSQVSSNSVLVALSAVKPEGAPEIDPRTLKRTTTVIPKGPHSPPSPLPPFPIYEAMASEPATEFDGESQVKDFVQTLLHFGGYNEMADILVNLTNLAAEMGHLVNAGYALTVLAPNDEAMAKITAEQLSDPGAPEQIIYYHIVPEYQTEESMYNAVRRFGKVKYETLRLPHNIVARESDGSVKFGDGDNSAYLLDPDIYTDGRISVQGIDGVLFPEKKKKTKNQKDVKTGSRKVKVSSAKSRRGKLLEVSCRVLRTIGQDSWFYCK